MMDCGENGRRLVILIEDVQHVYDAGNTRFDPEGMTTACGCGAVLHVQHDFLFNERNKGRLWLGHVVFDRPCCPRAQDEVAAAAWRNFLVGMGNVARLIGRLAERGEVRVL